MSETNPNAARPPAAPIETVPLRHPVRNLIAALFILILAGFAYNTSRNPRFQWEIVGEYIFSEPILAGVLLTLEMTALAVALGVAIGVVIAFMRLSANPIFSVFARFYIWFFRGVPLLVQLLFWYNIAALYPTLGIGLPFGPNLVDFNANSLITPMTAAMLALSIHEGAYMAEIIRGGILAIDHGQIEAAKSLGFNSFQMMRKIVMPQAIRLIVPPTGNQFISMLKTTSLISVLAVPDLLYSAEIIYSANFRTIPLLIVATSWYLFITIVLSVGQFYLEKFLKKS